MGWAKQDRKEPERVGSGLGWSTVGLERDKNRWQFVKFNDFEPPANENCAECWPVRPRTDPFLYFDCFMAK